MAKLIDTNREYANVRIEDCKLTVNYKLRMVILVQVIHSPNIFFELMLPSGTVTVLKPNRRLVKFLGKLLHPSSQIELSDKTLFHC